MKNGHIFVEVCVAFNPQNLRDNFLTRSSYIDCDFPQRMP